MTIKSSHFTHEMIFNPIQDRRGEGGGGKKPPPTTSFSPIISTNVGISLQNFPTFSLNLLPHWHKISRPYRVPVLNCCTSTNTISQKKCFFWSNPYKIVVIRTSLMKMLELPDFDHMTTSTI